MYYDNYYKLYLCNKTSHCQGKRDDETVINKLIYSSFQSLILEQNIQSKII